MKTYILLVLFFYSFQSFTQESRTLLRGRLLYRNSNVVAANVVNNTAQTNTITDGGGGFQIEARVGDEIIFSSVQYKIKTVVITPEIIKANRLVVSINERITVLDEIVVGPENQEKFLDLKKEEFTKTNYTQDKSTELVNKAADDRQLVNGLNIINIAKLVGRLLPKIRKEKNEKLIPSKVLPYLFDSDFFQNTLNLNPEETQGFIEEMDKKLPAESLFKKNMEFQLLDYLIKESAIYKKTLD